LLGTKSDQEIAAQLNRTFKAVRHRRELKGIPKWPGPGPNESAVENSG
jgi:hypothetical protein